MKVVVAMSNINSCDTIRVSRKKDLRNTIPQVRQEEILESLETKESVTLEGLSEMLGVSVSTVRRDVEKMVNKHSVEMLRGGVVRLQKRRVDFLASEGHGKLTLQKEAIARKAVALIEDGDIVFIDSGSTTSAMGKFLADKKITVVTTSTAFLRHLPLPNAECIMIGGQIVYERECTGGTMAEKQLSMMYFDKAFLSISGYTEDGVYANDIRESRNKEMVKERSHCTYLLADSTKLNRWGFVKFMEPDEGILITENDPPSRSESETSC